MIYRSVSSYSLMDHGVDKSVLSVDKSMISVDKSMLIDPFSGHIVDKSMLSHESQMACSDAKESQIPYRMTSRQEYVNALSMVGPSLYCLYFCYQEGIQDLSQEYNVLVLTMVLGTVAHMPFSCLYHLQCAMDENVDRIDNTLRRLDQIFIAVASLCFSFALSGSVAYFLVCLPVNATAIYRMLTEREMSAKRRRERRIALATGILLYSVPIAWNRGLVYFCMCVFTFFASAFAFANPEVFKGYGSAIFHAGMLPYQIFLLGAVPSQFA